MATDDDLPPLSPVAPPGLYRHYKGNWYEVLATVRCSETLTAQTLYRALAAADPRDARPDPTAGLWVRPATMFMEAGEFDGRHQPRFAPVDAATVPLADLPAARALITHLRGRAVRERATCLDAALRPRSFDEYIGWLRSVLQRDGWEGFEEGYEVDFRALRAPLYYSNSYRYDFLTVLMSIHNDMLRAAPSPEALLRQAYRRMRVAAKPVRRLVDTPNQVPAAVVPAVQRYLPAVSEFRAALRATAKESADTVQRKSLKQWVQHITRQEEEAKAAVAAALPAAGDAQRALHRRPCRPEMAERQRIRNDGAFRRGQPGGWHRCLHRRFGWSVRHALPIQW